MSGKSLLPSLERASFSRPLPCGEGALVSFLIKTPTLSWGLQARDSFEPVYLPEASPPNTISLVPHGHVGAGSKTSPTQGTYAERAGGGVPHGEIKIDCFQRWWGQLLLCSSAVTCSFSHRGVGVNSLSSRVWAGIKWLG